MFIGRIEYEFDAQDDDKALEQGRGFANKDTNGVLDFINWSVTLIEDEDGN